MTLMVRAPRQEYQREKSPHGAGNKFLSFIVNPALSAKVDKITAKWSNTLTELTLFYFATKVVDGPHLLYLTDVIGGKDSCFFGGLYPGIGK